VVVNQWALFLQDQGRWEEAIAIWQRMADLLEEHRAMVWEHIGNLYRDHAEELEQAIAAYENSYQADPGRWSALTNAAKAYTVFGKWPEATATYERLAEAAPEKRLLALANAAYCLGKEGKTAEAGSRFQVLLEEAPEDVLVVNQWALFLQDQKRWDDAIAAWQRTAELAEEDDQAAVWEHIGDLYRDHIKDLEQAIAAYENSYQADPHRRSALTSAAKAYTVFGKWPESVAAYEREAQAVPEVRLAALADAAHCLGKGGKTAEAKARFQILLEEAPEDAFVVSQWALFLEDQKRWEDAIAAWQRVADLSEEYRVGATAQAARLYMMGMNLPERGLEILLLLARELPEDPSPLMEVARSFEALDQFEDAQRTYAQIVEILGQSKPGTTAQRRLGWGQYKMLNFEAADQLCSQIPGDADESDGIRALLVRASIAYLRGNVRKTEALLQEAAPQGQLDFEYAWEARHDIRAVAHQMEQPPSIEPFITKIQILEGQQ
jgi:tetratricopeptide (TPR) repeat protein